MSTPSKSIIDNLFPKCNINDKTPFQQIANARYRQMLYIAVLVDTGYITDAATYYAYEKYASLCRSGGEKPLLDKIGFSKFVVAHFPYVIQNVKRQGKKYRIFRKR